MWGLCNCVELSMLLFVWVACEANWLIDDSFVICGLPVDLLPLGYKCYIGFIYLIGSSTLVESPSPSFGTFIRARFWSYQFVFNFWVSPVFAISFSDFTGVSPAAPLAASAPYSSCCVFYSIEF